MEIGQVLVCPNKMPQKIDILKRVQFFGQEIEKPCKGQCARAFVMAIRSLTITDAHNFGAIWSGIFFFGHFFVGIFFLTYFFATFLGQLLKAALLNFLF